MPQLGGLRRCNSFSWLLVTGLARRSPTATAVPEKTVAVYAEMTDVVKVND